MTDSNIQQAAEAIHNAKTIAILTGAGVSKESGVPTFRDAMDGLWSKYNPEELATPTAFKNNPKLVWDWYQFRRDLVNQAKPNLGHVALAEIQKRYPNTVVITQNVDDLHEQAGSTDVIHLHGNIAESKCFDDCQGKPTIIDLESFDWNRDEGPPACPHCGAHVRPNVVWFHEMLPEWALERAYAVSVACDVMIVIGTSGLVMPAAKLPQIAQESQDTPAAIIEVNPEYNMITRYADIKLKAPSGEILPKVIQALDSIQA
jgi:NAD-dependent deacetylase